MSFDIRFDYRFDATGFFADQARRDALEAGAAVWEGLIGDEFDDVPAGNTIRVTNPADRSQLETLTLAQPIDDLLVFVGADTLPGMTAALAGYSPGGIVGDIYDARVEDDFRGQGPVTNFEPWAGSITFDDTADFGFSLAGAEPGRLDFVSVVAHELGHILGFGQAPVFDQIAAGESFDGPNTVAVLGGPATLTADLGHYVDGLPGGPHLMEVSITQGTRLGPTALDRAVLADIGYEIAGFTAQGSTPPIATDGADGTIFGTAVDDVIDALGGGDQPQGGDGDDTIDGGAGDDTVFGQAGADSLQGGAGDDRVFGGPGPDTIEGGPGDEDLLWGDEGTDLFVVRATGGGRKRLLDFEFGTETIRLVDSGFATSAQAAAAVTQPFSNVYRLTLADGTELDVFHEGAPGELLGAAAFEIVGAPPPPEFSVAAIDADAPEGDAGSRDFVFRVTRDVSTAGAASVDWAVTGTGTAPADAGDFGGALPAGTAVFGDSDATADILVPVSGDGGLEPDEGFTVTLSAPSAGTIAAATASGVIRNDDVAVPAALSVAALTPALSEGDAGTTTFVFEVTRVLNDGGNMTVDWAVTGSGAAPADAADFGGALPSGSIDFTGTATQRTISVDVAGDLQPEGDEGFTLTLSNPSGGAVLAVPSATAEIRNDDAAAVPEFAIAARDADRAEGNSGTTDFTFELTRAVGLSGPASVDWAVVPAGVSGADFAGGVLPSGRVEFADGQTVATLRIEVAGDQLVEPDEGFTVGLSNPSGGGRVVVGAASGTIRNDDAAGGATFAIAPVEASGPEGDAGLRDLTFEVTRADDLSGGASISWAVSGEGASPAQPSDFAGGVMPAGALVFADGQETATIRVPVRGDADVEQDDVFEVTLSAAPSGATITTERATGTIENDDSLGAAPSDATGTIRGTGDPDLLAIGQGANYLGLDGDDVYLVSPAVVRGEEAQIVDTSGRGVVQLTPGLELAGSVVAGETVRLVLSNGSFVTVLGASNFEFELGGNETTGARGPRVDFEGFVTDTLGLAFDPGGGLQEGGPVMIAAAVLAAAETSAPAALPERGGFTPEDAIAEDPPVYTEPHDHDHHAPSRHDGETHWGGLRTGLEAMPLGLGGEEDALLL